MTTIDTTPLDPSLAVDQPAAFYPAGLFAACPTQPRKTFPREHIEELRESIARMGQIQPILARPNPDYAEGNGRPPYEIVCGECRWRACSAGDLPVLAMVRSLSDFEVLEIQIAENMSRSDLHPLEEAEGIKRLLRSDKSLQGFATVEELGARLGKSRRWVFARLQLLNLCQAARDVFMAGTINASVAGLIARMPNQAQQAQAVERIVQGFGGEPFSYRAAMEYLQKNFMLRLAGAPFEVSTTYQVAGPCTSCPKRSGANPELFDDVTSGDMCQDSACFDAKRLEAHEARIQAAREAGHQVLQGEAALKFMPRANLIPAGYHRADQPCTAHTADERNLAEILGSKMAGAITVEHPATDGLITLVPDATAIKVLKAKGLLRPKAPAPQVSAAAQERVQDDASEQAPQESKPKPSAPVRALSPGELHAQAETLHADMLGLVIFDQLRVRLQQQDLPLKALRLLIAAKLDEAMAEEWKLLFRAYGWEPPMASWPMSNRAVSNRAVMLEQRMDTMTGRELGELLVLTLVLPELTDGRDLDQLLDSDYLNAPTITLARELGLTEEDLEELDHQSYQRAREVVEQQERERLAAAGLPAEPAQDATAAFVASAKRPPCKYRCDQTGQTWSGRGLQPKWLKAALAQGRPLSDFEVRA